MQARRTGSSGHSSAAPVRHAGLDALRGLAILAVLAFHAWVVQPLWGWAWTHTVGQGAHGVGLFFLVSALTLAASWRYRQGRDRRPVRAFWARRWWRIAPLFYLALLLAWAVSPGNPKVVPRAMVHHVFTVGNLLAHLTFVFGWIPAYQNSWIGVEWSIGVEVTFYLFFPWLITRVLPQVGATALLVLSVAALLLWPWLLPRLYWAPWPHWAGAYLYWSFLAQATPLMAGLVVWSTTAPRRGQGRFWGIAWLALTVGVLVHHWALREAAALWALPSGLLTYLVWHDVPALRFVGHNRLLRYIGTRSYSWYLLHWVILKEVVLKTVVPAMGGGALACCWRLGTLLLLTAASGEITYRLVEQPGIRLGRRWIEARGWGRDPAPPSAMEAGETARGSLARRM